jgi:hypothetical protein
MIYCHLIPMSPIIVVRVLGSSVYVDSERYDIYEPGHKRHVDEAQIYILLSYKHSKCRCLSIVEYRL